MTDVFNDYRRKSGTREDPRLARREVKASSTTKQQYDKLGIPVSPKQTTTKDSWQTNQTQNNQYNSNMQTAYQHLPTSMYTEHNQYSTAGYQTSYPQYQQNYVTQSTYNPYQGYTQTQPGYSTGTVQPGPPGEEYPQNQWAPVTAYPNMQQPPASHQPVTPAVSVEKNEDHKKEAIAQELKQQKAQMLKQREEYVRKVSVLNRELDLLRNQKQELLAEHSSERDNNHILRENNKLQLEIQNKMKTICNVIDMLTNIIGDHLTVSELQNQYEEDSPKQRKEKSRKSNASELIDVESKFCYIYYDPELHWCRICDVFPKSAKEYLLHLHSKEHRQVTQKRDMVDTPWHRLPVEPELPSYEGASKKRMPIKGLQFLISATAWYCKLCDSWVGDLHCASQHLKSQNHNQNYTNFVEQNPHWEIEWLRDRDKALIRTSKVKSDSDDSDNQNTRKTDKKDKKKKKHSKKRRRHSSDSSSSSSSSASSTDNESNDKSKSIRVAMRNKMKLQAQMIMNEDVGGKWEVLGRLVEEQKRNEVIKESVPEDNLINQWMTINEPAEKDKRLFDNLKDRMKQKQEAEKAKLAEIEMKRREKEKQERDIKEKKEKEEQIFREKEEEKRRHQEELDRQREKEREQIRFKTKEKSKQSPEMIRPSIRSSSPEHRKRDRTPERHRRDSRYNSDGRKRSPSYEHKDNSNNKRFSHKYDDKESEARDKRHRLSSYKKPHFIGRMPLFKNKKNEERVEIKEIKKEDYDIPRQSRFQPGNLARAFIPEPEVVCFPRLSSIPPLMIPPPPTIVPPEPPKISESPKLKAPPPPIINNKEVSEDEEEKEEEEDENVMPSTDVEANQMQPEEMNHMYMDPNQMMEMDPATMMQYQYSMDYNAMMYSQMYDYSQDIPTEEAPPDLEHVPMEHTMPLPPPPLPPDDPSDDLAMLGISADDMAAQIFS